MAGMQLGLQRDPDLEPKRAKTLFISICIHIGIFIFLFLNPELFNQVPKRIIRIAGQDYDISKNQLTELVMPQQQRPKPQAQEPPLVQPPQPEQQAQQPPPPPPPPQPPKESPVIPPDATLAEGAKPDGTPKPSRGNTEELRAGSDGRPEPKSAAPKPEPKADTPQMAQNTNPNAMRLPNLRDLAGQVLKQSEQDQKRYQGPQGPRTGIPGPNVQENPDFSTEDPKILSPTYGYDFGPYLNQVLNRIRYNWYSLIPEIAKFKRGRVVIIFRIEESGGITNPRIVLNSGTDPLDRAAFGSITASNPFAKLPPNFEGDHLELQITFLYNINP
jgi:colicin import membrane protein